MIYRFVLHDIIVVVVVIIIIIIIIIIITRELDRESHTFYVCVLSYEAQKKQFDKNCLSVLQRHLLTSNSS